MITSRLQPSALGRKNKSQICWTGPEFSFYTFCNLFFQEVFLFQNWSAATLERAIQKTSSSSSCSVRCCVQNRMPDEQIPLRLGILLEKLSSNSRDRMSYFIIKKYYLITVIVPITLVIAAINTKCPYLLIETHCHLNQAKARKSNYLDRIRVFRARKSVIFEFKAGKLKLSPILSHCSET